MNRTHPLFSLLTQRSIPVAYYRGGTSRALMFLDSDLPASQAERSSIFLHTIGAPDPYQRQLNGLGAGISSLSKVCIVAADEHAKANKCDVSYTFVGIGIEKAEVDYNGNCGNMSAAIGPYAFNKRLLERSEAWYAEKDGEVQVLIWNTNTQKIIRNRFSVSGGQARVDGETQIDGVSGLGTSVTVDFLSPAGSKTGKLLPTGKATEELCGYRVSCVDAGNPCVFVMASDIGVPATILPAQLMANDSAIRTLDRIRRRAALAMGLCDDTTTAPRVIPKIALIGPAENQKTLSGAVNPAHELSLCVRFISDEQAHRAIPLTGALCTAVATTIPGTLPNEVAKIGTDTVTLGHPSGKIELSVNKDNRGSVEYASVIRTARRIFEGMVFWSGPA
jgi:2-methylaconitate cis-trans-isomerase PrpF